MGRDEQQREREPVWLNLRTIVECWDASLLPARVGPGRAPTGAGPGSGSGGAETPDVVPQHVIDARVEVLGVLADLARLVRDEQGQEVVRAPEGPVTIHHRVALVAGHADWVDERHPGHAARLDDARRRLERIVYPSRSDRRPIGYCTLAVPAPDGRGDVTCGGQVRAYPDPPDINGRVHYTSAFCAGCRTDAVLAWWADRLGVAQFKPLVTARELVSVLAFEAGHATTTSTIRGWVERGIIEPVGEPGPRGVRVFERERVLRALRERRIVA